MKKLQEIDLLVEEAINLLDFKDTNCWREILTTLARKCAEINEEDFDYYHRKILYYNSRLRDGQVETPEQKQEEKPALQPLPEEMPEWFMKGHVSAIRINNWNAVIQHFGTQPREWWHNLKKGDKFLWNNGEYLELKVFDGEIYLKDKEEHIFYVSKCSPYTDPTQSFREKLTPEMQVEFDKFMERNKT